MRKYFLAASLALTLIAAGCMDLPDKLLMPEWDVDLNVPITDKSYTIKDIVKDQKYISINPSDNLYVINSDKYVLGKSIIDYVKVEQTASSADSIISPVDDNVDFFLDLKTDNVTLKSAAFKKGQIKITARNNSNLASTVSFEVPGITNQDGTPFRVSLNVNSGEVSSKTGQLDGYKYSVPASQPPIFSDQMWIKASTKSSGLPIAIGNIEFDIAVSDFQFSSVTGTFKTFSVARQTSEFNTNAGDDVDNFSGKISLKGAKLNLLTQFITKTPGNFDLLVDSLTIVGKRNGQKFYLRDLSGKEFLNLTIKGGNGLTVFDETNSNITSFISFIPDVIEVSSASRVKGNNNTSTVAEGDSVKFVTDFNTTSEFALSKSTITDTVDIDISESNRSDILDGQAANVTVQVESAMPLTTDLKIVLVDKNYHPLFELTNISGSSLHIEGAQVNSSGTVTSSTKSTQTVVLNSDQIKKLSESYYAFITTSLITSGSSTTATVAVHADDWIKLKVFGGVKYRVKD